MKKQRGGFALGLVVGVLIGLTLALGVALYVTKVPVPFVNKVPGRSAEQEAAEAERNRRWNPNAPLQGRSAAAASAPGGAASGAALPDLPPGLRQSTAPAAPAARDPAAILSGAATPGPSASPAPPLVYFVQAGAYTRAAEAEQQRARLALLGLTARVSELEQSGRTVYRVRLGPYTTQAEADQAQSQLSSQGIEAALVRAQR
jgi:cell division protein FtsN